MGRIPGVGQTKLSSDSMRSSGLSNIGFCWTHHVPPGFHSTRVGQDHGVNWTTCHITDKSMIKEPTWEFGIIKSIMMSS